MDIINFRVSPLGDALELWDKVPESINFDDVTIKNITIIAQEDYVGTSNMPDPNVGYHVPQEDIKPKETILRISLNSIRLLVPNTGMYFLYVEREGEESEVSNPCICDKDITIAVAANLAPIYNKAIKLINSSLNNCNDNKQALLDIYLRKQTFLAAIELEEYQTAINIFKELLKQEIQSGLCLDINHVNNETIVLSGCKTCS